MAVGKLAVASPQIFVSDPVEQAFAQGLTKADPTQSGPLYALMLAARQRNDAQADQYRQDLGDSNKLAMAMAMQEQKAKMYETALKEGHNYIKLGVSPPSMPALAGLFDNPTGEDAGTPSELQRSLVRADIAHKLAQAAQANAAGQDQLTYTQDYDNYGPGAGRLVVKGRNADAIQKKIDEASRVDARQRGGKDPGPNAPRKRQGGVDTQAAGTSAALARFPGAAP